MDDRSPESAQGAQDLLGALLSNPELLRNVSALLGTAQSPASPTDKKEEADTAAPVSEGAPSINLGGLSEALNDPALMAKLPQVIELLKPMLTQAGEKSGQEKAALPASAHPQEGKRRGREDCRDDLLLALKPFLSPERCEAVDAIIRISRLGNVLKALQ
ncbi:MAG: hypothetical protein IJX13_00750 [Clostridia bacterium]|nr:hypothetical protein [Clostridia bacterium]